MDASSPDGRPEGLRPTDLFTLLWQTLANLVGTPATATLLRRSLKRAAPLRPRLAEVNISRAEHDYVFTLPPDWETQGDGALEDLRALFVELYTLSRQLTGSVIIRRLQSLPAFTHLQPPSSEDTTP